LRYYHKRNKEIGVHNQGKLQKLKEYNSWIVKPGENSNRGNGIKMCLTLEEIKNVLKQRERYYDGTYRTHIVQAYIERPLLYHKRKFDLRHYVMITCINGILKGYWYKEGYVRTTACEYSLSNSSGAIHLTNDAVQKNLPEYGKYEKGNKLSYDELNNYIEKYHKKKGKGFYDTIYKKMKHVATDAIRACSGGIDPSKLANNF
jgi:tubulin--tyrosine ligase